MSLTTFPYDHPLVTAATLLFLGVALRRALWLRFHPLRHAPRTPEPLIRVIDLISPPKNDPMKKLALYSQEPTYQPLVVVWGTIEGPVMVINDADLIKEILISGQANYNGSNTIQRGNFSRKLIELLLGGNGILNFVDQEWKWRRQTLVPLFQPRRLIPALSPYVFERVSRLTEDLDIFAQSGQAVEMDTFMVDLTFDIICKYLFGLAGEDELDFTILGGKANVKHEFDTMMSGTYSIWGRFPLLAKSKWVTRNFRPARERIESFIRSAARRSLALPDLRVDPSSSIRPVVHGLAHNPDYGTPEGKEPGEISQPLVTELLTLIFAGHDTTSHTAAFAFGEIARSPEVQRRLFEEVNASLGERAGEFEPEGLLEKLSGMAYLTAVIKETQRIYPVGSFTVVESKVDQILAGQLASAGRSILLNFRGAQMDPRYFPDPFTFDPTRWLASSTDIFEELDVTPTAPSPSKKSLPELAFSVGAHSCLGRNLALLELRVLIAFVLHRYEIALKEGTELDTVTKLTMMPKDGVWITLRERA